MKIKRKCKFCNKEFETISSQIKRGKGKFCSCECYYKARKIGLSRIKRICEQCGKVFEVTLCDIKRNRGKFCSRKCSAQSQEKYVKRICKQCGKEFEVKPSAIKGGRGKFCSRECKGKARRNKIKRICPQCGKTFETTPSRIKKGYGKFCSIGCANEYKKGENSPLWQGGKSFEPYCYKFNKKFKEYIRDKFGRVCFLCPKTEEENGRKLDVHHVNYNKNCGCDDDKTCQFVPLCRSCNSKVNHNREKWEAKIKTKMQNKLNGWYI